MPASFLNKRKMNTTAGSVRFQVSPFSRCLAVVVSLCKKKGVLLPKSTHALYRHIKFAFLLTVHVSGSRETDVCRHCHCVAGSLFLWRQNKTRIRGKSWYCITSKPFFCSSWAKSESTWLCPEEHKFEAPPPKKKKIASVVQVLTEPPCTAYKWKRMAIFCFQANLRCLLRVPSNVSSTMEVRSMSC